jgi:hypothetical protein
MRVVRNLEQKAAEKGGKNLCILTAAAVEEKKRKQCIARRLDFRARPPEGGYHMGASCIYYAYIITMCSRAIVEFEREIEFILRWIWFIQRIGVVVSEVHCCD